LAEQIKDTIYRQLFIQYSCI